MAHASYSTGIDRTPVQAEATIDAYKKADIATRRNLRIVLSSID